MANNKTAESLLWEALAWIESDRNPAVSLCADIRKLLTAAPAPSPTPGTDPLPQALQPSLSAPIKHMDTAPKDGTRILIKTNIHHYFTRHDEYRVVGTSWVECWYVNGEFTKWCGDESARSTGRVDPIGWAPTPAHVESCAVC